MPYKTVLYSESNSIATITLNRADKRNAISYALIDDVTAALSQAARSDAQIVILTGAGSAFCAGMDLENLKQLLGRTPEENLQDSTKMAGLFRALYDFPKPTIAAVNGAAIAGGTGHYATSPSLSPMPSSATPKSASALSRASSQAI